MMVTTQAERPWEGTSGKVAVHHRDRLAVVYVRQSTLRQLRHNTESAKLQYALVERAVMLGWPPSRTLVIDEDMGHSASGAQDRPGFTRLVSEVGLGHVGVVLGIEMSRLARSGRDWHQLLELCALSRTLLADPDGVYDPAEHNDRLLLGLKGTISEAELYLIKQRMWGGRIAKARRGELGFEPPIGYWRRLSGEIVIDPDEQVQSVIRLLFAKFEELGTLHALLAWLVANGIELGGRQRCRPERGEVVWRRPNRTIVRNTIRSPVYAGIYAYGRKHTEYHGAGGRAGANARSRIPRTGWSTCLDDCPPTSVSSSGSATWPGWRPTATPRPPRAPRVAATPCSRACCGAASAANGAWACTTAATRDSADTSTTAAGSTPTTAGSTARNWQAPASTSTSPTSS
ncbi:recombinase family protein [Streptomyces sp. NPDC001177]